MAAHQEAYIGAAKVWPSPTTTVVPLATTENGLILIAYGNTLPTDTASGYAIGCLFIHTDGGDGSALYVNEGTDGSADFNLITVAAA